MSKKLIYVVCFGLVLGLIATNTTNAQDPNLLGWWKLDEPSGNIAYDSSGNGNDGQLIQTDGFPIGDPQWGGGYAGGALWLDGVDDFIEVPHNESLLPTTDVTVMAWINTPRLTGAGGSNWQGLITKGNAPRVYSFYTDSAAGGLHFSIGPEGSFLGSNSTDPVPLDEWVHVCAMLTNGNHLYYINGEPSPPLDNGGAGSVIVPGNTATVRIGNAPENNSFMGKIDDVRVYNKALSQEEIQLIMISGLSSKATRPSPDNGAKEVFRDTLLSWKEGQFSDTHNVYFGTDFNDVSEASVSDPRGVLVAENQADTTFDPTSGTDLLEYEKTYHWRVDEINGAEPNSPWIGDVWSFTTVNFVLVDDFEGYDDANNIIYETWSDYFVNNTGMTVGYLETPSMERTITHSSKQSMPLKYDNDGTINEGTDLEKTGTLLYSEAVRQWTDPQDWTKDDVESLTIWFRGHPPKVSSFVEDPAGVYTVKGIGRDIYERTDEFHFVYKELSGGCKIIAKVNSLENTDPFARAGIMIRDTLDSNARYCGLFMTPENGVRYQFRVTVNDVTDRLIDPNVAVPYWLRIERTSGGLVRAYYSQNGSDWTAFSLRQVSMANPIYVGLAVSSHNADIPCEAVFSNVSFPDTTVSSQWNTKDIGILTNDIEPLYAVLNNNTVIYNDDPNAALADQWTEWNIPLQNFADRGANLTSVSSFGIGLGHRENPQSGGKGTIYIDDIRLYRPAGGN
jgi:hypothetical protein